MKIAFAKSIAVFALIFTVVFCVGAEAKSVKQPKNQTAKISKAVKTKTVKPKKPAAQKTSGAAAKRKSVRKAVSGMSDELLRLKNAVPSAETFGGGSVIWQRGDVMTADANGAFEKKRTLVVMFGEHIPDGWQEIVYPHTEDSSFAVEEAARYNPVTCIKEHDLSVARNVKFDEGAEADVVKIDPNCAGSLVVVVTREKTNNTDSIEWAETMSETLPVWERNVEVTIPSLSELFWAASGLGEPTVMSRSKTKTYRWQITNQMPANTSGLLLTTKSALAFSTKKGFAAALKDLDTLAEKFPEPSSRLLTEAGTGAPKKIEKAVNELWEHHIASFPDDFVRGASDIAASRTYSRWEQAMLAAKLFKHFGYGVNIWWTSKIMPDNDKIPAAHSMLDMPILEITKQGEKKSSYCIAGLPFRFGKVPSAAANVDMFRATEDGDYDTKVLKPRPAAENALDFDWDLKVGDDGSAKGTLNFTVTGGWNSLFDKGDGSVTAENAVDYLTRNIAVAMPNLTFTVKKVHTMESGYKIAFAVECIPAIVHADRMLMRIPGAVPRAVAEIMNEKDIIAIHFPFKITQNIRMKMPKHFRLMQMPPLSEMGSGTKSVLRHAIKHWPGKLAAESIWTVKDIDSGGRTAQTVLEELSAQMRWSNMDLPFKRK
ncbi:MAG: hypothetical protein Q4E17_04205 [Synergistes sp.]|nr:hypothetical protein [Synergistes sp.]